MIFKILILCLIFVQYVQNRDIINFEVPDLLDFNEEDNNDFESKVFDSFYKLSDLEDYPDICNKYSDENCAILWLNEIHKVALRNRNRFANVHFKYVTDINRKNFKLKKKFQLAASKIGRKFKVKVSKFKWKSYKSLTLRKIFYRLTASLQSKNETISIELIKINNQIASIYNNGKPCFGTCLKRGESGIVNLFRNERDYDTLEGYWTSWNNVTGAKMRNLFINRMNLENKGAQENGYHDVASFILDFDFEEKDFKSTIIKLYNDILPFYKELHAYVRYCLAKYYPGRFDEKGPIPAHLFGNVWAQQWSNIFPIIQQCQGKIKQKNYQNEANDIMSNISVKKMFKMAEQFYESIGMPKMTDEFWERSMLKKPPNKLVNCHGSAHDLSNGFDYRIKMCTEKNLMDFTTIHHEMGHIQYYMAYRNLPLFFRGSANSGFHEAIGDTIALAVKTPEHLKKIGLIAEIPKSKSFDIDYLMATALEKVVFLPFALTMETYIWSIYNGSVPVTELNKFWWDLRYRFQGIKPPNERTENDFDAGAKYHIAFSVSYIRYFVSFIIQFQFYESMCDISGYKGPLHRCDFYQSEEAGSRLLDMLKKGRSQHWRKTMKILTGQDDIQTESLLKFFQPLHNWLKSQNEKLGIQVGW